MHATPRRRTVAALLAFAAGSGGFAGAAEPDSTLFTTYSVATDLKSAEWIVCGSTKESEGCYADGSLGPFGHIGAMLESPPVSDGNAITREIYVLDVANGKAADVVALLVYTKTDIVTATDDSVTVNLHRKTELPLVGGKAVTASMAANNAYLYVSTNQSSQAVIVDKHDLKSFTTLGAGSPAAPVASITADSYGYVTVPFGAPNTSFAVFGPTGEFEEDGGGGQFMLDDFNAVIPAALPF
jgi:hypothetical protein